MNLFLPSRVDGCHAGIVSPICSSLAAPPPGISAPAGEFSKRLLGEALAKFIQETPPAEMIETAQRTGLREVDLAFYGVNALCQALIYAIDPHLEILTPLEERPHFVFTVKEAVA